MAMHTAVFFRWQLGVLTLCLCVLAGTNCGFAGKGENVRDIEHAVQVEIDRAVRLPSSRPITKVAVINPKVAEATPELQSDHLTVVRGLKVGTTQLLRWGGGNKLLDTVTIVVRPNISGLKRHLYELFPEERILVSDSGDSLTLTGTVSSASRLEKVVTLAEHCVGDKAKVVDLLQVGGIQQVMLEVRVAEISKKVGHQLGINFGTTGKDGYGLTMLNGLTTLPTEGWPGNPLKVSSSVNAVLGFVHGGQSYIAALDALQEDGLLSILAKPTLIAQSGRSASFLAGGEFPFPVSQGNDQVTIEWKPFGVGLNFTPTVLGNNRISLVVAPEVSDLDFSSSLSYNGYIVPSINTRRMSTVVELGDNQSFAIAGLMKNQVRESVSKFPLLGDIPILGPLFRSSSFQKDETELVVIVTPHLVKPVDGDNLPLPTDSFQPPNAFEFLMLGRLEAGPRKSTTQNGTGVPTKAAAGTHALDGDFGHIIPE